MSVGIAFPLRNLSYFNLAYQVGKRGVLADNGMEEQYHRITIGLTLSDLWFQKQKSINLLAHEQFEKPLFAARVFLFMACHEREVKAPLIIKVPNPN